MSHFAYIGGSLGAWATGTTITAAKLWQLDQNQYAAINGDGGGTWSPTAKIVIGGANGLELSSSPLLLSGTSSLTVGGAASFTGSFSATGTSLTLGNNSTSTLSLRAITTATKLLVCQDAFVAQGNTTIGLSDANTLTVNATSTFNAEVSITQSLDVGANTTIGTSDAHALQVNSTATFGSAVNAQNNVVLGTNDSNALVVNSESTFNSYASFASGASFGADVILGNAKTDVITLNGRLVVDPAIITFSGGNASYDGLAPDRLIASGDPGTVATVTFSSANAVNGLVKRVSYNHTSTTGSGIVVKDGVTGNTLVTLGPQTACEIVFLGTRWYLA